MRIAEERENAPHRSAMTPISEPDKELARYLVAWLLAVTRARLFFLLIEKSAWPARDEVAALYVRFSPRTTSMAHRPPVHFA